MTKSELNLAAEIAFGDQDLTAVDDSPLHGFYLPSGGAGKDPPIYTTLHVVAKMMRWTCQYIAARPGEPRYDAEALAEFCKVARKRVRIISDPVELLEANAQQYEN